MKELRQKKDITGVWASLLAIVSGLLIGFIVLAICNPSQALNGIKTLLFGGFTGGIKSIGNVLYYATPLLLTGLGIGFAFQSSLFNIGGPGQFIFGAFCSLFVAIKIPIPGALGWIIPLFAAMAGGAFWALLPGILRAYKNVNIVISTIMMNYIGMYLVNALVKNTIYDPLKGQSAVVPPSHQLPSWGLDKIFTSRSMVNCGILIAIFMAIVIYILLNKTTFGYELKACGKNRDASRYAGINEKKNIVLAMVISGALVGLGGGLMYLASAGKYIRVVDVMASEGFNGIAVALLAMNNPIGIIFSSIFMAYLDVAGFYMQTYRFSPEIVDIIVSVIIYFSAFSLLVKEYISKIELKKKSNLSKEDK